MSAQREHGIAWTEQTWNPVRGCSRVSEGCRSCYAERVAARFSGPGQPYEGLAYFRTRTRRDAPGTGMQFTIPSWTGKVVLVPERMADPLRWRKPRRVFVNSMSDLFHEALTNEQIAAVFGVMAAAPQHTFQVLTKRAARMREWFTWIASYRGICSTLPLACAKWAENYTNPERCGLGDGRFGDLFQYIAVSLQWPLSNVWLGVSVEDQATAAARIPLLLQTPAAVRWVSYEPALGPVHWNRWLLSEHGRRQIGAQPGLSWIVFGGESGPGARACDLDWARSTRGQCKAAGVSYFHKQGGASNRCKHSKKGGCLDCAPTELRVREYPR